MILKRNETLVFALLLLATFQVAVAQNQTVNIGDVYVSPETEMSIVGDFDNTSLGSFTNNGDVYAYSNWNNEGIITFDDVTFDGQVILGNTDEGFGFTRFIGENVQEITGSEFSFLNNALFNNTLTTQPAAFLLSGDISIATNSNFTLGIVDNDTFGGTFLFEDNATHTNTSDDSHVNGFVNKLGDDDFMFPIGDKEYFRFAAISAPNTVSDDFKAKYFFEDTNANYPTANLSGDLVLIDAAEHWVIERSNSSSSEVLVTLSWRNVTTPAEILADPLENIHVARWDATNSVWVDEGGLVDTVNQTVTTMVALDTFGVFTLARVTDREVLPCGITIENTLITPNTDTFNDFFELNVPTGTTCVNDVHVKIFNRWGVIVFEGNQYGLGGKVFNGYSEGRANFRQSQKLPSGTYFYILTINYTNTDGSIQTSKKTDYLYVNGD